MFWIFAIVTCIFLSLATVNPIPLILFAVIYALARPQEEIVKAAGPDYSPPATLGCLSVGLTIAMAVTALLVLGLFAFGEAEMIRIVEGMNP